MMSGLQGSMASHALVLVFGLSSWLLVNAVWVELALLVEKAPEGYGIASFMAIALQCANVFPLAYSVAARARDPPVPYALSVWCMLILGTLSSVLLALFWSSTLQVLGQQRSVALIGLLFFGGALDCTSSVVYWPYIAQFDESYTSSLATGESLSGSLPALIAIAQAPADATPRFSASAFFLLMTGVMAACSAAFALLQTARFAPAPATPHPGSELGSAAALGPSSRSLTEEEDPAPGVSRRAARQGGAAGVCADAADAEAGGGGLLMQDSLAEEADGGVGGLEDVIADGVGGGRRSSLRRRALERYTYACWGGACWGGAGGVTDLWRVSEEPVVYEALLKFVVDGVAPSLAPFAASGYAAPRQTLMWAIVLSNVARPLGAHLTTYTQFRSRRLGAWTAVWAFLWGFVLIAAFQYKNPPFRQHGWALVCVWVAAAGSAGYTHAMLFVDLGLRCRDGDFDGADRQKSYRWAGMSTQAGALVGTILSFVLVNMTSLFSW